MSPARVSGSIIAAFGGAALAPLLGYLGFTTPFPSTAIGLVIVAIVPGVLCRSFTAASTTAITGVLAGVIAWLTVFYNPVSDAITELVSRNLFLDPVLAYILLMVAMAVVSGVMGLALAPAEEVVIKATLERPAGEEAAPAEAAAPEAEVAAEAKAEEAPPEKRVEERVAEAAVGVAAEEIVYVKCIHCGEAVPEEAVFCPNCGKRVKSVGA